MYYDDFEVNDPIGNHTGTQSIAAFYYSFPVLHSEFSSKLQNIFPAKFLQTKNLKKVGPNTCLSQLIKIFIKLEKEEIEILTENSRHSLHAY